MPEQERVLRVREEPWVQADRCPEHRKDPGTKESCCETCPYCFLRIQSDRFDEHKEKHKKDVNDHAQAAS